MPMRYYEFKRGTSRKYWTIWLAGKSFTTTWGRIDDFGQSTTKKFGSSEEAERQYEKLSAAKARKGYRLVESNEEETESQRLAQLPRRVAKQLDWDGLEAAARPGPAKARAAGAKIPAVPGLAKVPPGYREFLRRFAGAGYWDLVYQKKGWPNGFALIGIRRMPGDRKHLLSTYRTEAPKQYARVKSLVPFATNASDAYFCWDSSAVDARGEPPVYAAEYKKSDSDGYKIKKLGKDLLSVLQHYRRPDWSV